MTNKTKGGGLLGATVRTIIAEFESNARGKKMKYSKDFYVTYIKDEQGNWQISRICNTARVARNWCKFFADRGLEMSIYQGGAGGIPVSLK